MRRMIAAVLAALLIGAIAAPITCVGWESSAEGRRQCCRQAAHSGCQDQHAADNCCAAHEQSRHLTPAFSSPVPAAPLTVTALPVPALDPATIDRTAAILLDVVVATRLHGPPFPLISPLRI